MQGLVIKAISGFYTVVTAAGETYVCRLPGKLKRAWQVSDIVAVGDHVVFTPDEASDGQTGLVDSVAERERVISRTRPSGNNRQVTSDQEQVLVANPDQVIFVFAIRNPEPSLRKLDRLLVMAERSNLPVIICVNKIDLGAEEEAETLFGVYEQIGYPVLYTSVTRQIGIEALRERLLGKISVFSGSSGVGKSSLLNSVQPDLGRRVSAVSKATGKGLHTTRYSELIPLEGGGYVADTPGIRGVALYDIEAEELDAYFVDIAPLVPQCQFSNCTHKHEPGCAVRQALADGQLSPQRYDSYLRLREEHETLHQMAY
ncbi:MAG: ribosome small subunit-dependent GTPase A [Chloroflexi bacterium]|nr:ribosome small subunit-dependent GTPase A [Chloroflexota bacterium]